MLLICHGDNNHTLISTKVYRSCNCGSYQKAFFLWGVAGIILENEQKLPKLKPKSAQSVFPDVKQGNASVKTNRWKKEVFAPPRHEMKNEN